MPDEMTSVEKLGASSEYMDAYHRGRRLGHSDAVHELAVWMIEHSYATGHGDTLKDLLDELSWQFNERIITANGK